MGLGIAGDDHEPRGIAVEPVHDPRALGLPAPEQVAENVDQGLAAVAGGGVDDQPGRFVDHREPVVDPDQSRIAQGGALAGAGAKATNAITTTPAVIATSARLKAGHSGGSRKSVTAPSRIRSARLPSAPPTSSPTPSHRPGAGGVEREPGQDQRQRGRGEEEHEPVAAVVEEPEGDAAVGHPGEVEAERDVHALARHHRGDHQRLRHLVEDDDQRAHHQHPRPDAGAA